MRNLESRFIYDLILLMSFFMLQLLNYNNPFYLRKTLFILANSKFLSFLVYFSPGIEYLPTKLPFKS